MTLDEWPDKAARYEEDAHGADQQRRWQEALDRALAAGSLQWQATGSPTVFTLVGRCPRCGHRLAPTDVYFEWVRREEARPAAVTNIVCSCDEEHAGRGDDQQGCGWALLLEVAFAWPSEAVADE